MAVVGYAAAGIGGGLLTSAVAFTPSFAFIVLGAHRFDRLRTNQRARAFLDALGPPRGAILGSAIILATALTQPWQYALSFPSAGAAARVSDDRVAPPTAATANASPPAPWCGWTSLKANTPSRPDAIHPMPKTRRHPRPVAPPSIRTNPIATVPNLASSRAPNTRALAHMPPDSS